MQRRSLGRSGVAVRDPILSSILIQRTLIKAVPSTEGLSSFNSLMSATLDTSLLDGFICDAHSDRIRVEEEVGRHILCLHITRAQNGEVGDAYGQLHPVQPLPGRTRFFKV